MSLKEYKNKRDFLKTKEPSPKQTKRLHKTKKLTFVIQEHHARRLHWDFRLEWAGALKSWAVTKQPSLLPKDRRLAIETEDHPLEYAKFHGEIPRGEYGGGKVLIWDQGTYTCNHSIDEEMEQGTVKVNLKGKKLKGSYVLVRISRDESGPKSHWLFFREKPKITGLRIPRLKA